MCWNTQDGDGVIGATGTLPTPQALELGSGVRCLSYQHQ